MNAVNRVWPALFTCAVLVVVSAGCDAKDTVSPVPVSPTPPVIIFDSGQGTGQYDSMTYFQYFSEVEFTPQADMNITAIRPQIWYCNGTSGFLAVIRDERYSPMSTQTGWAQGTGEASPKFADRRLDPPVKLSAGKTYVIQMEVWTTASVGIYTTGSRTAGVIGSAEYSVHYAHSDTYDHLVRGAIAFELLQ